MAIGENLDLGFSVHRTNSKQGGKKWKNNPLIYSALELLNLALKELLFFSLPLCKIIVMPAGISGICHTV